MTISNLMLTGTLGTHVIDLRSYRQSIARTRDSLDCAYGQMEVKPCENCYTASLLADALEGLDAAIRAVEKAHARRKSQSLIREGE